MQMSEKKGFLSHWIYIVGRWEKLELSWIFYVPALFPMSNVTQFYKCSSMVFKRVGKTCLIVRVKESDVPHPPWNVKLEIVDSSTTFTFHLLGYNQNFYFSLLSWNQKTIKIYTWRGLAGGPQCAPGPPPHSLALIFFLFQIIIIFVATAFLT